MRKMSETKRQREMKWLTDNLNEFKEGKHNEIYIVLEPIAKMKYAKDQELASFQERLFQEFILDGDDKNYSMYYVKRHDRLLKLRSSALLLM
jgi:hypothetical protein